MVDIARDPRWGRIIEGAGEDPYLGAAVAAAQVRGFQGAELGAPDRVIAGPKHFAGYGSALGGRDYDEVNLSDSELWNVVFPPFRAAVEAGAGNVMTAYMDLNGIPATGNRWLFTEVLRDTWGFEGFVVSDANAVRNLLTHGFAADLTDAGARAVNAGVDMEMAISDAAYAHLPEALDSGATDAETIDASVRRVLEAKIRMGLFDDPVRRRGPRPRRCSPIRPTATWPGSPPSGPRCCCATRAACCPSTPPRSARSRSSDRWPTPRATPSGRGSSTSTWTRRSPCSDGIRARAGDDRPGRVRPRRAGGAARVPVAVRHVRREHPDRPRGVRRGRRVPAGRRPGRREPMSRSSWSASGRT